jgi:hypothetical protein
MAKHGRLMYDTTKSEAFQKPAVKTSHPLKRMTRRDQKMHQYAGQGCQKLA